VKILPAYIFSLLIVLSVACSSDDDDGGNQIDSGVMVADSAPMTDTMVAESCLFDNPITAPSAWQGIIDTADINSTPDNPGDDVDLAASFALLGGGGGAPADIMELDLLDTLGPFTGGFGAMSIDLSTQSDPTMNCGACLYILADVTQGGTGLNIAQMMWVESGTLELTTVSPAVGGMVVGELTGAVMREINPMTGATVSGGCTTTLPTITVNATLMAPSS